MGKSILCYLPSDQILSFVIDALMVTLDCLSSLSLIIEGKKLLLFS